MRAMTRFRSRCSRQSRGRGHGELGSQPTLGSLLSPVDLLQLLQGLNSVRTLGAARQNLIIDEHWHEHRERLLAGGQP